MSIPKRDISHNFRNNADIPRNILNNKESKIINKELRNVKDKPLPVFLFLKVGWLRTDQNVVLIDTIHINSFDYLLYIYLPNIEIFL